MQGLPRESALWREVAPEASQWGTTEELLAGLIELTDALRGMYHKAHFRGSFQPVKIARPTDAALREERPQSWRDVFRSLRA